MKFGVFSMLTVFGIFHLRKNPALSTLIDYHLISGNHAHMIRFAPIILVHSTAVLVKAKGRDVLVLFTCF